jgi:hypothetical protein
MMKTDKTSVMVLLSGDSGNVMNDMHKLPGQKSMIKMNITITVTNRAMQLAGG